MARTLAWRDGAAITLAQCVAEAAVLAERLPANGQPVNLCSDRYLFTLALLAALLRGQTSLMPPNAMTRRKTPAACHRSWCPGPRSPPAAPPRSRWIRCSGWPVC
jgi:hypothetical protein